MIRSGLVVLAALGLSSCYVKNRVYNPVPRSVVAIEDRTTPWTVSTNAKSSPRTDHVDANCRPSVNACLAFIEFDEMGEMWDPGQRGESREAGQLDVALNMVERAKSASPHPIIVVFIHGWKNNANREQGHENGNVVGFEGVLEFLKNGKDESGQPLFANSPVVGIYVSWRGDLISKYWPVSRQVSYFNRERAAIRIPGASMTAALTQIMVRSHRGSPGARLIMVGHSFGGLIMERTLTQAMTDFILRQKKGVESGGSEGLAQMGIAALDLTPELRRAFSLGSGGGGRVVVGQVEPGTPAAAVDIRAGDVIETLDQSPVESSAGLRRRVAAVPPGAVMRIGVLRAGEHHEVEISSHGDTAWADLVVLLNSAAAASEGKQLLDLLKGLEYAAPRVAAAGRPSDRPLFLSISSLGDAATRFALPIGHGPSYLNRKIQGSWRKYDSGPVKSQSAYYLSTTAHMQPLQSHLIVETKDVASCGAHPVFVGRLFDLQGRQYRICEKPGRWNDTPYWAMQMPATIVPDHTGIFTTNVIQLLVQFLPTAAEMRNPSTRPVLRLKSAR